MDKGDNRDSGVGFLSGLIIGSVVGAALAIVLAPQSGEETRDLLRGKAHEAKNKAIDLAYDMKDRASAMADDLKTQADQLSQLGRQAFESTRAKFNDAVDTGRKAAQGNADDNTSDL